MEWREGRCDCLVHGSPGFYAYHITMTLTPWCEIKAGIPAAGLPALRKVGDLKIKTTIPFFQNWNDAVKAAQKYVAYLNEMPEFS